MTASSRTLDLFPGLDDDTEASWPAGMPCPVAARRYGWDRLEDEPDDPGPCACGSVEDCNVCGKQHVVVRLCMRCAREAKP